MALAAAELEEQLSDIRLALSDLMLKVDEASRGLSRLRAPRGHAPPSQGAAARLGAGGTFGLSAATPAPRVLAASSFLSAPNAHRPRYSEMARFAKAHQVAPVPVPIPVVGVKPPPPKKRAGAEEQQAPAKDGGGDEKRGSFADQGGDTRVEDSAVHTAPPEALLQRRSVAADMRFKRVGQADSGGRRERRDSLLVQGFHVAQHGASTVSRLWERLVHVDLRHAVPWPFHARASREPEEDAEEEKMGVFRVNSTSAADPAIALKLLSPTEVPPTLLDPDTASRATWDMFVLALVLLEMLMVPYSLGFDDDLLPQWMEVLVDVCFVVDLFVNCVTTFYLDNGLPCTDHKQVLIRYSQSGWLWLDLFCSLPLDYFVDSPNTSLFKGLKLIRMVRVGKIFKRVHELLRASGFRIVRLIAVIIIVVHWAACAWVTLSGPWAEEMDLESLPTNDRYVLCFFSSIQLLFRNLHVQPRGDGEELFASAMVILGACLQASVFGSVAVLLAGFDEAEVFYRKRVGAVTSRMEQLKLPRVIQRRVLQFYSTLWERQHTLNLDTDDFIGELSEPLISDIKLYLFRDMVQRIPFLRTGLVGPHVVEALVHVLTTRIYLKNDLIIRKGESGDWMGFIGQNGEVAVIEPDTQQVLAVLGFGEYIGELALLFTVRRMFDIRALTWLRLHKLSREDYLNVKKKYPAEGRLIEEELQRVRAELLSSSTSPSPSSDEDEDEDEGPASKSAHGALESPAPVAVRTPTRSQSQTAYPKPIGGGRANDLRGKRR